MGKVIAVSTNKGGALKTSIVTNLAGVLCENSRVLIVDTDGQGNTLIAFGVNPDDMKKNIYDVLVDGVRAESVVKNVHRNIDILPANDDMYFLELDVLTKPKKYPRPLDLLKERLAGIRELYDYILIDTSPNLGLMQGNVLSFADQVIIPFQTETFSMRSLVKMVKLIKDFKKDRNHKLEILGVVATLVDLRTVLHTQSLQECRKFCAENEIHMFETVITRTVRFATSFSFDRLPTTIADPKHPAAELYFNLYEEVINRGEAE